MKSRKSSQPFVLSRLRVDAVVTDPAGHTVPNLAASDFALLVNDKPTKVLRADYFSAPPLRIVFVVDDLSLSRPHLDAAKAGLHRFLESRLRSGDEASVIRTSRTESVIDVPTADRAALAAAVDRLAYGSPEQPETPIAFAAGSLSALRAVLEGLRYDPGRKMVVFLSERLRQPDRANQASWTHWLVSSANLSGAVVYALDAGPAADPSWQLDQGLAVAARDTGGAFVDGVADFGAALARVIPNDLSYYVLNFEANGLGRLFPLSASVPDKNLRVRARIEPIGIAGDKGDAPYRQPGTELGFALNTATGCGLGLHITPVLEIDGPLNLAVRLHIDGANLTFTQGADGLYVGTLEAAAAVFQNAERPVEQDSRQLTIRMAPPAYRDLLANGIDYDIRLRAPQRGPYQIRAAVLNDFTGETGAAGLFYDAPEPPSGGLSVSAITLRGETDQAAAPGAPLFHPGQRIAYSYDIFNLHLDPERRARIEVVAHILRDGAQIYTADPKIIEMTRPGAGGFITLGKALQPGNYQLQLTITDRLAPDKSPRSVTKSVAFEVRP